MNKYLKIIFSASTLILILLITNNLFAQTTFEGIVKIKMTADDESFFIDYFIKDDNMRMEINEEEEVVFIKSGEKSLILMLEEKTYMDLNNPMFKQIPGMSNMEDDEYSSEPIDINKYKTGKTKNILGHECEQWVFSDQKEDVEIEAWVTDELGNFMMMKSPMGGGFSPNWGSSFKGKGFFPLLVITRDEDGEETSRFEVVNVDQKGLNNDLFHAPSDFEELKIPGM